MARLLQIAELGHPVLDTRAEEVKDPQSPVIQELADDMLATLDDIGGFGLSAPQVYESLKIFVTITYPSSSFPNAPRKEPTVVVNPEILQKSEKEVSDWESCLSIPGLRGRVSRAHSIKVRYTTREGDKIERELSGIPARAFQHEHDHLEGIVFLDRMKSVKDLVTEKEYKKIVARKKGD